LKRVSLLLLSLLVIAALHSVAIADPPTETATPTGTPLPSSTPTITPTPTPTPTPDYWVELITPGGEPARLVRETRPAQLMTNYLLFGLLISLWLMYIVDRLGKKKNVKN